MTLARSPECFGELSFRWRTLPIAAARLNEQRENWLNPADLVRREPEVVPGYPDRILPRDPTIAAKFNTYRLADHKEAMIDLLARVARVSVDTVAITDAMRGIDREGWG